MLGCWPRSSSTDVSSSSNGPARSRVTARCSCGCAPPASTAPISPSARAAIRRLRMRRRTSPGSSARARSSRRDRRVRASATATASSHCSAAVAMPSSSTVHERIALPAPAAPRLARSGWVHGGVRDRARRALHAGGPRAGERLLVNGAAGGVGAGRVQLGVAAGAQVTAHRAAQHERLEALGADTTSTVIRRDPRARRRRSRRRRPRRCSERAAGSL